MIGEKRDDLELLRCEVDVAAVDEHLVALEANLHVAQAHHRTAPARLAPSSASRARRSKASMRMATSWLLKGFAT